MRFTGGKRTASEATKIISENLPHSPKAPIPKSIMPSSTPHSTENSVSSTIRNSEAITSKPQINFVKKFDSITENFQRGPISNNTTSSANTSSVNNIIFNKISKRDYATYTINAEDSNPSPDASKNNPKITVAKGKKIAHNEIVRNLCSHKECNGIVCIGLCGTFVKGQSVGHVTHGASNLYETDRTTVKVSDKDFKGQNKQQNAVMYQNPHTTNIPNQPEVKGATKALNDNLFGLKNIDDAVNK
jgi:hypothetical protein